MAQLWAVVGREVRFVDVPEQAARRAMSARLPPALVEALLEFYRPVKAGQRELASPDLERLLGRKPRSFATWASENAQAFG